MDRWRVIRHEQLNFRKGRCPTTPRAYIGRAGILQSSNRLRRPVSGSPPRTRRSAKPPDLGMSALRVLPSEQVQLLVLVVTRALQILTLKYFRTIRFITAADPSSRFATAPHLRVGSHRSVRNCHRNYGAMQQLILRPLVRDRKKPITWSCNVNSAGHRERLASVFLPSSESDRLRNKSRRVRNANLRAGCSFAKACSSCCPSWLIIVGRRIRPRCRLVDPCRSIWVRPFDA